MNKNCAFTICTKSYIGLALVLQESIYKYYSDVDFYIFVADELPDDFILPKNAFVIKDLNIFDEKKWYELAFKYNVTEFCTCLKPFMFNWLFENKDAEKICYMDPDLFFFDSAETLYKNLDNYLIELTPHFCTFPENEYSKHFEDEIRFSGIYNLGFLGLKKSEKTKKMLDWWGNNLKEKCFGDSASFQFTDQKWLDFVTLLFDLKDVFIVRDLGWNVAPWNYFERKISKENDNYYIENRNNINIKTKLIFAHFSGFSYKNLIEKKIIQNNEGHDNQYEDVNLIINEYIEVLNIHSKKLTIFFNYKYTYNFFSDENIVLPIHRRIYRSLLHNNFIIIDNPFDTYSTFYKQLKKRNLFYKTVDSEIKKMKKNNELLERKISKIDRFFFIIYKIIGCNRYCLLLRFLRRFSRYENQTFLLNSNFVSYI